jgi:hypothetical protein
MGFDDDDYSGSTVGAVSDRAYAAKDAVSDRAYAANGRGPYRTYSPTLALVRSGVC